MSWPFDTTEPLVAPELQLEIMRAELDVLLVGVAGAGEVAIDGAPHTLRPGCAILIPKGARRAIGSTEGPFSYLSCHRRRAMLWPANAR